MKIKPYKKRVGSGSVNSLLLASILTLNACGESSERDNIIANIAGVNLKKGKTDSSGWETFKDDYFEKRIAELYIDDSKNSLENVKILFADGHMFKMSLLDHPNFEPQLEIALHNSEHHYSLTPAPLQILNHDKEGKERSLQGAKNAFEWTKSWSNTGCYNKEELAVVMQPGAYLVKLGTSYLTAGASNLFIKDLAEFFKSKMDDDEIAEAHSFIPSQHGIYGLTSISSLDIKKGSCDTYQEKEESYTFYDDFDNSLDKWDTNSSAYIDNGWLKMEGLSLIRAKKDFSCDNFEIEYSANLIDGSYGLYFGDELVVFSYGGSLKYACLGQEKEVFPSKKIKVIKKENSLNLIINGDKKEEVKCSMPMDRLIFYTGTESKLEVDYVNVNCE